MADDYSLDDLVRDVTEWHVATFGNQTPWGTMARKVREESWELYDAMRSWQAINGEIIEESADVLILLCTIAGRNGIDLIAEARKKLEIVKGRDQRQRDIDRGILHSTYEAAGEVAGRAK